MKLLSLDTSSSATGWALFIDGAYYQSGIIDLHKIKDTNDRLDQMIHSINELIDTYSPTAVVTEMTVVLRNPQVQRLLTMILGAVYGICVIKGIEYCSLRPTEWRRLVDPGKKPKKRDELKQWSVDLVDRLFDIKEISDDVSDAILIGQALLNERGVC